MVKMLELELLENERQIQSKDMAIKQKTAEIEKGSAGTIVRMPISSTEKAHTAV